MFSDIKVNDTVLVYKEVTYGFRDAKSFLVSQKVDRVTDKRFYVNGDAYNKEDGKKVGDRFVYAHKPGEKITKGWSQSNEIAKDQTYEFSEFTQKINQIRQIRVLTDRASAAKLDDVSVRSLNEVIETLKKLEAKPRI